MLIIALIITLFLAFANGANDNFKGVATLYGSGTTPFKTALIWASVMTFLGSVTALILANGLIANFSGKGLVPDSVLASPSFLLSVGLAAAITVQLATYFGFPISTTHALIGGLIGAGAVASSSGLHLEKLGTTFLLPLILSPIAALLGAGALYSVFHMLRMKLKLSRETCVCIETGNVVPAAAFNGSSARLVEVTQLYPQVVIGTETSCAISNEKGSIAISPANLIDRLHFLSAGIVSFARGLNDTPKLAAILLVASAVSPEQSLVLVAIAMAIGGFVGSRRVAETISKRVTTMSPDQGFVGNVVTGLIVVLASKFGLPVSTTHVSCGSLFGIGAVTRQAKWRTISVILLAWVTTLPLAATLGAFIIYFLKPFIGA